MPTVFLSYSSRDLPRVNKLEAHLKKHRWLTMWRDKEKLHVGELWPKRLGEAIAKQDLFLLAWSKNSASSHFIEFEWCTALALKKLPAIWCLDGEPLPASLRTFHISMTSEPEKAASEIIASLTRTRSKAPRAEDKGRRTEVIRQLAQITTTKPEEVLQAARTLFDQRGWVVQGDVIQAGRDITIYYHSPSSGFPPRTTPKRSLKGQVLLIEDNDELTPAVDVSITLLQTADRVITGLEGLFTLPLPGSYLPGSKVELTTSKEGWVIYWPPNGEITIPASDTELVKLRLVKKGSRKLWSSERIEKFTQEMASKAKEQVHPEGKPQEIDFSRYIKDWAMRHGFSAQQAKAKIDRWVAEVERQDDPYRLGLAAGAKKKFGLAGMHFEKSAGRGLKKMRQAEESVRILREHTIRDYRLAGDARYNQYEFNSALMCYQQALQLVLKEEDARLWADILIEVAKSHNELGIRIEGDRIRYHFAQAVEAYQAILTVYTKDTFPQEWATAQNNLGNALRNQGIRTEDKASTLLFAHAVKTYRAALTVRTKKRFPQDWAATQNSLGNSLSEQGTKTPGKAGTLLLAQAIKVYRAVLTVYTKDTFPQEWATAQNNLGNALRNQGPRTPGEAGTDLIAQGIKAYRAALTVRTKKKFPQDWATTQSNLGNALRSYGTRSTGKTGTQLLAEAVTTYREALTVRTINQLPKQWATTSSNLAEALFLSGKFAEARDLLTTMLQYSALPPETKVALLIVEIANLVGLGTLEHNRQCFDKLQRTLGEQISDFTLKWSFSSIKLFIRQDEMFARHRTLLLRFIESLENKQRDELLTAVKSARTGFLKIAKS